MLNKLIKTAACGSLIALAGSVQALELDVDVTTGNKWVVSNPKDQAASVKKSTFTTRDTSVGVHVKPAAQLPLTVGARVNFVDLEPFSNKMETARGWEISPEVVATVPAEALGKMGEVIAPYAKFNVTMKPLTSYSVKQRDESFENGASNADEIKGESQGFGLSLGTAVKLNERVNATAEYAYASRTFESKTGDNDKVKSEETSNAILLGAQVRL